jgi:hypothetical protein
MTSSIDLAALRQLLENVTGLISTMHRHVDLGEECERLGLPTPPDEGSKHERVKASLAHLPYADLPMVADKVLASQLPVDAVIRNKIQDVLWASYVPARYQSGLGMRSLGLSISLNWYTTPTDSWPSCTACGCWVTTR